MYYLYSDLEKKLVSAIIQKSAAYLTQLCVYAAKQNSIVNGRKVYFIVTVIITKML